MSKTARQQSQLGHGAPSIPHYQETKTQPASANLPFSFTSFIAVGTSGTADRTEISSPCAV